MLKSIIKTYIWHQLAIYGGFYSKILKALCTKNKIPYVSPLEENSDSNVIIVLLQEMGRSLKYKVVNKI